MAPVRLDTLLAKLPKPAADLARRAQKAPEKAKRELFEQALSAIAFPEDRDVSARVADLTAPQRALAEIIADEPFGLSPFALPRSAPTRRRWLGIDPPRALDTVVDFAGKKEPLWRALQLTERSRDEEAEGELFEGLPLGTRLAALQDTYYDEWPYGLSAERLFRHVPLKALDGKDAAITKWARAEGERLLRHVEEKKKAGNIAKLPVESYSWPVFVALARAKALEPRWDALLPLGKVDGATVKECVSALPKERRIPAILAALEHAPTALDAVVDGCALFPSFPSSELYERLVAIAKREGFKQWGKEIVKLGKKHAIAAAKERRPAPALKLTCISFARPRRVEDLDRVRLAQLRLAGKTWDGHDLPARARLANDDSETSLADLLEYRVIGASPTDPLYDALTYAGDSGMVFQAGTTKVVAEVVQNAVECSDERLAEALTTALRARPKKKPAARKKN
jgi:hypothetical protein